MKNLIVYISLCLFIWLLACSYPPQEELHSSTSTSTATWIEVKPNLTSDTLKLPE